MTTLNTSLHTEKEGITTQLQMPHQHIGETISWLVEQSVAFELHFLQNLTSELSVDVIDSVEQEESSPSEQNPKNVSVSNTGKTHLERHILEIFDKYIIYGLKSIPPTQEDIATELGISVSTFKIRFKKLYGNSFYQVYLEKKMEHAALLLQQGHRANKVSAMVGYAEKSVIKFNKMFQKHFGITPRSYQMQNQKR